MTDAHLDLSIWSEPEDSSHLRPLSLRLRKDGERAIVLCAVDENGHSYPAGELMAITNRGKLFRFYSVNPNLGLKLGRYGRVLADDDDGGINA